MNNIDTNCLDEMNEKIENLLAIGIPYVRVFKVGWTNHRDGEYNEDVAKHHIDAWRMQGLICCGLSKDDSILFTYTNGVIDKKDMIQNQVIGAKRF